MAVQGKGAIIVLDDGGADADDLIARVDGAWPEVYRITDHDESNGGQHVLNVGSKHLNTKTLVRQMYEEQAFFGVVPGTLDPVTTIADFLSAARGYLADGFPAFVLISGRPDNRYRKIAVVLDPSEPITTGSLALAAVGLAWRTGASLDALLLAGSPDDPPGGWADVREMFKIREGAEFLDQAEGMARENGIRVTWHTLGISNSRDQLVLSAVREHGFDLVVDDLRPIDVGPRIGRKKRVYRQLVADDSVDTAYRLLRDAPCDVAIIVDAVRMRLIPANYAKGAAIAALSVGLLGVAARPAAASASETPTGHAAVEAPLDPAAEAAAPAGAETTAAAEEAVTAEQAVPEEATPADAEATTTAEEAVTAEQAAEEEAAAPAAVAPTGTPAPSVESIPADVTSEEMASYEQSQAQEQATLQAEQQELATLQQQQADAETGVALAEAGLATAQHDLVDAEATLHSAEAGLDYAQGSRTGLSDSDVSQAQGSFNRAQHDLADAQADAEEAEAALGAANAEARAAAEATAAQQAVVDAQAANVNAWSAVVNEADARTDQRVPPVAGYSVTTHYGAAGSNWSSGYHTGSDFAAPSGTEVVAAASGTVVAAGFNGPYGNQITIEHDDGSQTTYSHLSSIDVSAGDTVSAGEQIGAVGSTGNSTGPHLHFEAFDSSGNRVNPEEWLVQA